MYWNCKKYYHSENSYNYVYILKKGGIYESTDKKKATF